jgi:hypothetical protein
MGEMKRAIAREREAWAEKMQEQSRMKSTLVIAAAIIAEPLRLAEHTLDRLVQILARPGRLIAPKIDADKSVARSMRNNLPCFSGHRE